MEIFNSNTLAVFRNFFNDEMKFSQGWRVALIKVIFPLKIKNVKGSKSHKKLQAEFFGCIADKNGFYVPNI